MQSKIKKDIASAFIIFTVLYLGLLAFLFFFQRSFIYFPNRTRPDVVAQGVDEVVEIAHVKSGDLNLEGWYFPPADENHLVLVYFHGNASNYGRRMHKILDYLHGGYGVLLAGYRGYGGNPGTPTEQGLYEDARAYVNFLLNEKKIPAKNIVFYGESLGSAVAVQMATEYPVAGLVLEAGFSSTAAVAQQIYFYVPVGLLMQDQFQSVQKISKVHMPLLFIHGDRDGTVPLKFGKMLFEAANEPKTFRLLQGAGHNDLYQHGAALHVLEFLSTISSEKR